MKKTKWITKTAVMIVLLVVVQSVTKPAGQFVTGSCVNLVLAVAAVVGGLWCGAAAAAASPFFAFLLGIGTPFVQIVPAIAAGNLAYVCLLSGILKKCPPKALASYGAVAAASAAKFLVLFVLVTKWLGPMVVPETKLAVICATFSWPQLVTALIGGAVAVTVIPLVRNGLQR